MLITDRAQDITTQHAYVPASVPILERIVRFYIVSTHLLCEVRLVHIAKTAHAPRRPPTFPSSRTTSSSPRPS